MCHALRRRDMPAGVWWENLKKKRPLGKIILKQSIKNEFWQSVDWMYLAQVRD
jgi:hypothetical protein